MTFLLDNRNARRQYGYPRRGGGYTAPQITLHTYEAPYTRSLRAAATWLLQRPDPGSYHALVGDASPRDVLQLAPWSYETWHCVPSNNWAIGISAVMYAHQWKSMPEKSVENIVKSMAFASANAAQWLERHHGRKVEPRLLTRAQAMRKESGFVHHRIMDPGRRTDPANPQRDFPWDTFITEFQRLMRGGSAPAPTPANDLERLLAMTSLDDIARAVWGYRNEKLTTQDAYAILRQSAKRSEQTNHAVGRMEGVTLPSISERVGAEVDSAEVAAALVEHLDIEGAIVRAIEALPERDTSEVAEHVRKDIAARLSGEPLP